MKLVVVFGPVASGKLTVGRELAARTGLPLFHNHLVVDTVLSVFPFGSPEFVRLRDQFWVATFEAAARSGRSLVFTFAPEPTVPHDFIARTTARVQRHGGDVALVELRVDRAEQERRVDNPDRRTFGKLTDREMLAALRQQVATPGSTLTMPPADVVVDTTRHDPAAAAARIATTLGLLGPAEPDG